MKLQTDLSPKPRPASEDIQQSPQHSICKNVNSPSEGKCLQNKQNAMSPNVTQQNRRFSEAFYGSIEAFLDKHALYVVSPTPARMMKNYALIMKSNCDIQKIKSETEIQALKPLLISQNKSLTDVNEKKSPFLRQISASSLLNKRKKFGTID